MQPSQAAGTPIQSAPAGLQIAYRNPAPNHHSYVVTTHYQIPNPNPPIFDSAAATSALTYDAAYYALATTATASATSAVGYYQDPYAQTWPTSYVPGVAAAKTNPISWKNIPKKRKIPVQHVWCEVCKIECNSKEILDSHKQGKKHKKNIENLKAALAPAPVVAPVIQNNPIIGPQPKPPLAPAPVVIAPLVAPQIKTKKRKAKKNACEDLETKKKKIVEGGTAVDAVRTCDVCNVVCNNELVFKSHLAGKKHQAKMKFVRFGPLVATAT